MLFRAWRSPLSKLPQSRQVPADSLGRVGLQACLSEGETRYVFEARRVSHFFALFAVGFDTAANAFFRNRDRLYLNCTSPARDGPIIARHVSKAPYPRCGKRAGKQKRQ